MCVCSVHILDEVDGRSSLGPRMHTNTNRQANADMERQAP